MSEDIPLGEIKDRLFVQDERSSGRDGDEGGQGRGSESNIEFASDLHVIVDPVE